MYLYLYIVANRHPEVMARYRYLVLANSRQQAIAKMEYADGNVNKYCTIESCDIVPSVADGVWYLPMNTQEPIE
jgi:hypothetical protein